MHCGHAVHFSADLSLWLDSPMSWHPDTKVRPPTPCRLFQFHIEERWDMDVQTKHGVSRTVEDRC